MAASRFAILEKFHYAHRDLYLLAERLTDSISALEAIFKHLDVFKMLIAVENMPIITDLSIALSIKNERHPSKSVLLLYLDQLRLYILPTYTQMLELNILLERGQVAHTLTAHQIIDGNDSSKILFVCNARADDLMFYDAVFRATMDRYSPDMVTRDGNCFCVHRKENSMIPNYSLQALYDYLSNRHDIDLYTAIYPIDYMPIGNHKCRKVPNKTILTACTEDKLRAHSYTFIDGLIIAPVPVDTARSSSGDTPVTSPNARGEPINIAHSSRGEPARTISGGKSSHRRGSRTFTTAAFKPGKQT